jgi:hypothetical protein
VLKAPFSSLRVLNEDLHIPRDTVWGHVTKSLGLYCRQFKLMSYMLTEELRKKRVDDAKALLKALEA